jgi:dTDP-4-dehydrorhamnose reductase
LIAIIGGNGQLGQELFRLLGPDKALALSHAELEISSSASIARALDPVSPTVVVNTAAFNHVDDAELRPADALAVNALGPRELARYCQQKEAVLVHFSTDYVFGLDRTRQEPYGESDLPGPVNAYGLSKLAGEYLVRPLCPRHFVVRTCGLYSRHGHGGKGRNFVQTMLRLGRERGEVRVVSDQRCTPTWAADLAQAILQLLDTDAYGTYHYTNSGSCTWYEFACEIFTQSKLDVRCSPITTAQYGARALRPAYSVLATARFEQLGFARPRAWREALGEFLADLSAAESS